MLKYTIGETDWKMGDRLILFLEIFIYLSFAACTVHVEAGDGDRLHPYISDIFDLMQEERKDIYYSANDLPANQVMMQAVQPVRENDLHHGVELDFQLELANSSKEVYSPAKDWQYVLVVPTGRNRTAITAVLVEDGMESLLTKASLHPDSPYAEYPVQPTHDTFTVRLTDLPCLELDDCMEDRVILVVFAGTEPVRWRPPQPALIRQRRGFLENLYKQRNDQHCYRRQGYYKFKDIGMTEVIKPEGIIFRFCQGYCPDKLPLINPIFNQTNHATIKDNFFKQAAQNKDKEVYKKLKTHCVPANYMAMEVLQNDGGHERVVRHAWMIVRWCQCA